MPADHPGKTRGSEGACARRSHLAEPPFAMTNATMASARKHLTDAVRRTPLLVVPLALAALLLLAAAVALLPFAAPLAIGYVILRRSAPADAPEAAATSSRPANATHTAASVSQTPTAATKATPPSMLSTPAPTADRGQEVAPLTGSAALMAKMRRSGAVTGERRAKDAGVGKNESQGQNATVTATDDEEGSESSRLFILHGGEASVQIARDLAGKARARGLRPRVVAMDDFKSCALDSADDAPRLAVFVVETVENAQPAEAAGTCLRFYNRKRKAGERDFLRGKLAYAVLGLGDTNLLLDRQTTTAKDCNQAAQTLDSALLFLGAERLVTRGEANDAVGLEEAVEPWSETLWPAVEASLAEATKRRETSRDVAVRFLYGSQTGNAAEICKAMAAEAATIGSTRGGADASPGASLATSCSSMNETDAAEVLRPGAVTVFVVSSTGDGDAPDNCDAFFTRLKRAAKTAPGKAGVGAQYCVLGLGDQNYSAFMAVPRAFTAAMEKAGATAFYPRGEADDTLGLYEYAETWQEGLWAPLRRAVQSAPAFAADPERAAAEAAGAKAEAKAAAKAAKAAAAAKQTTSPGAAGTSESVSDVSSTAEEPIVGVPAMPACRARVVWLAPETSAAETHCSYPAGTAGATPEDGGAAFSAASPFLAPISKRTLLTDPRSDRRVVHVEFDLSGASASGAAAYEPGDSIGVLPANDPTLVARVAERLGLDLAARFDLRWAEGHEPSPGTPGGSGSGAPPVVLPHIRRPATVRDALTHAVDLTSPARKSQLRAFAEFCADADPGKRRLLALCAKSGKSRYAREILEERASTLDLLNMAPSCFAGSGGMEHFGAFLDAVPPLQPRMYSITTAPETAPATPAVAFSVVRFASPAGATREGVATNWLDRLGPLETARVPVFIKRSVAFRPPETLETPTLMIGPGTGVAPFRGFLQRRAAMMRRATEAEKAAMGPCRLFFGCRRAEEDFLYRQDLEAFEASGVLDALHCAFSRENPEGEKRYVQHLIGERRAEIAALVAAPGARVYVCGDGGGMAKDVHAALRDALATRPEVADEQAADAALAAMTKEGRYVRDIWS